MTSKTKVTKTSPKAARATASSEKITKNKEPRQGKAPYGAEPQTMADLLEAYGSKLFGFSVGQKVTGKVVYKDSQRLVLDIGGKSEGLVIDKSFKDSESYINTLNVGDTISGSVLISETPDGYTIVSLRTAADDAMWGEIEKKRDDETPVDVVGRAIGQSGITVDFGRLTGFIPNSQIGKEAAKDLQSFVGKSFKAQIIDVDRRNKKVILSEKSVSEKEDIELSKKAVKLVTDGQVYDGVVTNVYDFGVFVTINVPITKGETAAVEGLVHISEISWEKSSDRKRTFNSGDKVKVKVIGRRDGKLAFSVKQTQEDPWNEVGNKYSKDTKVKGVVARLTDFGMFVSLEPGVEGLVHMTKIPPGAKYSEGDEVNVYVEEVDKDSRKIALGLVLTAKPLGYK